MANYLIFKNLLKEQNLKLFENEFFTQTDGKIDKNCIFQEKLIFIYIQRRAVKE